MGFYGVGVIILCFELISRDQNVIVCFSKTRKGVFRMKRCVILLLWEFILVQKG